MTYSNLINRAKKLQAQMTPADRVHILQDGEDIPHGVTFIIDDITGGDEDE